MPKPYKARAIGVDEQSDVKARFLAALRETRNPTSAAEAIGYSRRTVYHWKEDDKEFREAWNEIWMGAIDKLEASALARATDGVEQDVFHQGTVCGTKTVFDGILTIFMLKKNRPDKYEDRLEVTVTAEEYASQVRDCVAAQEAEARRALKPGAEGA